MSEEAAVRCTTCPRGCLLAPGKAGLCRARKNVGGKVQATSYGRVTSIALDPVEKKPLARWKPGSKVLSLGSYGCNLRCPWCQNYGISQAGQDDVLWREVTPEYVVALAQQLRDEDPRTVGIAYTYNDKCYRQHQQNGCSYRSLHVASYSDRYFFTIDSHS